MAPRPPGVSVVLVAASVILAVQPWKGHDGLRYELFPEIYEGSHGGFW